MNYHQLQDGEWTTPIHTGYKLACCGCGLKHRMDFRVIKGKHVQFRAYRLRSGKAKPQTGH